MAAYPTKKNVVRRYLTKKSSVTVGRGGTSLLRDHNRNGVLLSAYWVVYSHKQHFVAVLKEKVHMLPIDTTSHDKNHPEPLGP